MRLSIRNVKSQYQLFFGRNKEPFRDHFFHLYREIHEQKNESEPKAWFPPMRLTYDGIFINEKENEKEKKSPAKTVG